LNISVIIVNYRGWNALQACLDSLNRIINTDFIFEVIVVDNCSADGKLAEFVIKYPRFIFIENTSNKGFANGCNLGAENSSGEHLLFLNPDTIVTKDALQTLLQTYKVHPEIGILSCLQINENEQYYKQANLFPSFGRFFGISRAIYRFLHKTDLEKRFKYQGDLLYPDWVSGAVIFISREWFNKAEGWNEDYWLYFEDVDLCKKVKTKKGKVAVTNQASIFHKHGGASRINIQTKSLTKSEVIISKHVYIDRHFPKNQQLLLHMLLILGVLIEKGLLSIFSLLLFFIPKLKVNFFIFKKMGIYYWNAIRNKTWISPRSVNYPA